MILPLPDFKPTLDLLERYRTLMVTRLPQWQLLLLREATHRLRDLELLGNRVHSRCKQLLDEASANPAAGFTGVDALQLLKDASTTDTALAKWFADNPSPQVVGISKGLTLGQEEGRAPLETREEQEVRLDTELFYYVAHRFCTCLALLPELRGFQCKEVAVVRNHLLEHPEKPHSGVLLPAFGYRSDVGPVIKGMRYSHQSELHPDAGFIPNCRALLHAAETALKATLSSMSAGES